MTPMPWTGPAPRTRTGRGFERSDTAYTRLGKDGVLATDDPQCVCLLDTLATLGPTPRVQLVMIGVGFVIEQIPMKRTHIRTT